MDNLTVNNFSATAYDFLNVRYVIERDARLIRNAESIELIGPVAGLPVGERDPYPRAFWVSQDAVVEGPTGYTLRNVDKEAAKQQRVEYERMSPKEIRLRGNAPEAGYVFLSEVFYPGWKAEGAGESGEGGGMKGLPIRKVNGLFRLIPVEAGKHTIRVFYRPYSFGFGVIVSVLAAFAWLTLLIRWKRIRKSISQE